MLITFSCETYENITMIGDIAKQLLNLMGHSGTVPGAIVAEDIPEALSRLELAIKKNKQTTAQVAEQDEDEEPQISLAHRSFPLINMLKSAMKHNCNVMWE